VPPLPSLTFGGKVFILLDLWVDLLKSPMPCDVSYEIAGFGPISIIEIWSSNCANAICFGMSYLGGKGA